MIRLTKPPVTLPFWHPACLLSTWFGAGLLPRIPGTWGSAAALPFAWLIASQFGTIGLLAAAAIAFCVGIWAAGIYVRRSGIEDPGPVVIDEVAGQWLTLAFVPVSPFTYLVGFFVFRVFDVLKPWPAGWADRRVAGGFGAMLDDMLAAFYACAVMFLLARWVP